MSRVICHSDVDVDAYNYRRTGPFEARIVKRRERAGDWSVCLALPASWRCLVRLSRTKRRQRHLLQIIIMFEISVRCHVTSTRFKMQWLSQKYIKQKARNKTVNVGHYIDHVRSKPGRSRSHSNQDGEHLG